MLCADCIGVTWVLLKGSWALPWLERTLDSAGVVHGMQESAPQVFLVLAEVWDPVFWQGSPKANLPGVKKAFLCLEWSSPCLQTFSGECGKAAATNLPSTFFSPHHTHSGQECCEAGRCTGFYFPMKVRKRNRSLYLGEGDRAED